MLSIEEKYELSLYEELTHLDESENIILVKHMETGELRVKKILETYNEDIFLKIKNKNIYGIPEIFFVGEEGAKLIVVEEYLNGRNLEQVIREKGPLDEREVSNYICQLCDIVENLHNFSPKIIHRDIKPANIILTPEGIIKLIDYDAAKEHVQGKKEDTILMGTKEFAAPEQYGFMQSDERTDIYGIGVTLNYLLTGNVPKEKLCEGRFGDIVTKATRIDPEKRYRNIGKLKNDLEMEKKNPVKKIHHKIKIDLKIIIGALSAICLILMILTQEVSDPETGIPYSPENQIMYKTTSVAIILAITLYIFNFCNMRSFLMRNSKKKLFNQVLKHIMNIFIISIIATLVVVIGIVISGLEI